MAKVAVVIGGGHNGLMAAITLRESGFKVTLIEARDKVGGMADTESIMGVKVSRASYVIGLMPKPFLEKFNLPLIRQDPFQVVYVNGRLYRFGGIGVGGLRPLLTLGRLSSLNLRISY